MTVKIFGINDPDGDLSRFSSEASAEHKVLFYTGAIVAMEGQIRNLEKLRRQRGMSKSTIKALLDPLTEQLAEAKELLDQAVEQSEPDFNILVDHRGGAFNHHADTGGANDR